MSHFARSLPKKPSRRIGRYYRHLRFDPLEERNLLTFYGVLGDVYHQLSANGALVPTFPLAGALVTVDVHYDMVTIDQGTAHLNSEGQAYTQWGTGHYSAIVDLPDSTFAYSIAITGVTVRVSAESNPARTQVVVGTPNGTPFETYHFDASPAYNVDQDHNINMDPIMISQATVPMALAASFAAFTNLLAAAEFIDTLNTSPPERVIAARYDTKFVAPAWYEDLGDKRIHFNLDGPYSIDVMAHEAGHWFAHRNGFHNLGLGGTHSFDMNLRNSVPTGAPPLGLQQGAQFAFNEGFATWFSFVVQDNVASPRGTDSQGKTVSEDGWNNNGAYDWMSTAGGIVNSKMILGTSKSVAAFEGEDDEAAVVRFLWSLYDAASGGSSPPTDRVQMSPDEIIGGYIMAAV